MFLIDDDYAGGFDLFFRDGFSWEFIANFASRDEAEAFARDAVARAEIDENEEV